MIHIQYILAFLLIPVQIVLSQHDFTFSLLNAENCGLTTDHVNSVFEDNEGIIWMATANGLNRFDGKNCSYFLADIHNPNSLSSNFSQQIVQDKKGRFWISGKNGLTIYDPRQRSGFEFRKFTCLESDENHLPVCRILDMVIDDEGIIWCSPSDAYFLRIDPESETFETIPTPSRILWLYYDAATYTVAAGSIDRGFYELDTRTCMVKDHQAEFISQIQSTSLQEKLLQGEKIFPITNVIKDSAGNWWMAGVGTRLLKYNPEKPSLECFSTHAPAYSEDFVRSILLDVHGTIWAGTSGHGIFTFDIKSKSFAFIMEDNSKQNGLVNGGIISLNQDSYHNIWICTQKGVSKLDPAEQKTKTFSPVNENSTASFRDIGYTSLFEDETGMLWFGTHCGAFTCARGGTRLIPIEALSGIVIYGVTKPNATTMLFGTLDGVREYDIRTKTVKYLSIAGSSQDVTDHFFTVDVTKFLQDTIDGNPCLWIGTNCESLFLYEYSSKRIRRIPEIRCAYDIEKDKEGRIWIGSAQEGVFCIPDKTIDGPLTFVHYEAGAGGLNSNFTNDIMIDHTGNVWVLNESGINIIQQDTIIEFRGIDEKIDPVLHLEQDAKGNIWFMSTKRLFRYDTDTREISKFNCSHTLSVSYADYNWMYKLKSEEIFIPSENKWTVIQPDAFTIDVVNPKTVLTEIKINGENRLDLKYQDHTKLPHTQHSFDFGFAAHPYTNSKLIQFEWMLEGYNTSWTSVPVATNRVALTNLAPGPYVFRVKACSSQGIWDDTGALFTFSILPPWWQTWWFRILVALTSVTLIYWVIQQRTQRLLAIQRIDIEKKLALEAERSRISRDMHDDLGSGLSAIHLLSNYVKENALEKYPEFSHEVDQIQKSSENLNQAIREIIWTVNAKDDTLQSLILFIQRFSHEIHENSKIPVYVQTPDPVPDLQLDGVKRKHAYLCVKEAVNNAIKHGSPKEIHIQIQANSEKCISIRITDNGKGFMHVSPDKINAGNGLSNMKERMSDIGGKAEIHTSTSGTEIHFTFQA